MTTNITLRFKKLQTTKIPPCTQKARGVWVLTQSNPFKQFVPLSVSYLGINSEDETQGKHGWPWEKRTDTPFARPCPETPRHGFVDSQQAKTLAEAEEIFSRALQADPKAELLLMPFIEAKASGIFIPESGVLVVGSGHDGATSGKESFTLPVVPVGFDIGEFRDKAGIAQGQHIYLELVEGTASNGYANVPTASTWVVQARSGPVLAGGITDFIPKKTVVKHVIKPSDDMLAWESLCVALAGSEGVVAVGLPGSIASHPAVQCRIHNIPYLTHEVSIGETIEPRDTVDQIPFDVAEFHRGVRISETLKPGEGLKLAICILHNSIPLEGCESYSRLLGYALGSIFRGAAGACLGESRHFKGYKDGKQGALGTTQRDKVYERAGELENNDLCTRLATFSYKFMHESWSSGYGGFKWYAALVQTIKLWNLTAAGKHLEALAEANLLLNMAHNGGWLFNKFFDKSVMDRAAEQPAESLAANLSGLLSILKFDEPTAPIKVRNYRSSAKWKFDGARTASNHVRFSVNNSPWKPMPLTAELKKVLHDTFDNV